MELATSQLLFLLAIGVFAALGYAAYRYFAKPSINILDQLKEQGVERDRKDWPWNDWTWEARDQYAERAAAAALLPGADLVAVPNSDADGDKPVTITDVPSTDGSFTEGERTVLLVRRAMVVLARAPVFNAHRAEALKMKEQGLLPDEDWQRFVDAITSLNKEGKDIELDAYKVKSGEKYKTTIFQQANHYTQYLNAPAPRFSFVAWTWPHRDAFRRAAAAGRLGEQTEGHPPVGVQLLVRRAASVIQRVPEFQKQQPAVNELKAFTVLKDEDFVAFQQASKDLMEENKALEIDIKSANSSPDFAKAIFVQAHQYIALEQKQMEEARKNKAEQDQKAIAEKKSQASPSDDEAKLKRDEEKRARIAQELLDEEEQQKQKAELRKRGGVQQSPVAAAAAAAPVAVTPSKVAASGKLNVVDPVVTPGSGKKKSK